MKWILGVVSLSFLFTSCDNELVVTDQWKDIPVVWAFMNKSDTAHYIRVEKAYLDPTTSAYDIARIPDSLYYDNATVMLRRIKSGQFYNFTRVDGDLEGYSREDGVFAESPNYLFKIKANQLNLVVGDEYEFLLQRNDFTPTVIAKTFILASAVLRSPQAGTLLLFKPGVSFNYNWDAIKDAGVYDLLMRFHYLEKTPETGNFYIPKSVEWAIARGLEADDYPMDGGEFYSSVKANIEVDPEALRLFESIDIVIWGGGEELAEFIKIANANTGLTATQDIPTYTNLSEGLGIFTSRSISNNTGFELHNQSLDSLRNGSVTKDLNFQ